MFLFMFEIFIDGGGGVVAKSTIFDVWEEEEEEEVCRLVLASGEETNINPEVVDMADVTNGESKGSRPK